MSETLKARVLVGTRKVGQSATACLLLMTQGNLASITLAQYRALVAERRATADAASHVLLDALEAWGERIAATL